MIQSWYTNCAYLRTNDQWSNPASLNPMWVRERNSSTDQIPTARWHGNRTLDWVHIVHIICMYPMNMQCHFCWQFISVNYTNYKFPVSLFPPKITWTKSVQQMLGVHKDRWNSTFFCTKNHPKCFVKPPEALDFQQVAASARAATAPAESMRGLHSLRRLKS